MTAPGFLVRAEVALAGVPTYTWAPGFRRRLIAAVPGLVAVPTALVDHSPQGRYGLGYQVPALQPLLAAQPALAELVDELVEGLCALDLGARGLLLLDGLLPEGFPDAALRSLLACAATRMRHGGLSPRALHSPEPLDNGFHDHRFPLHADLFGARTLLNVFRRGGPQGPGGDLLLLPSGPFLGALGPCGVAPEVVLAVADVLHGRLPPVTDGFDLVFQACYAGGGDARLERCLAASALRLPAVAGRGYIVADGHWLHGRDAMPAVHLGQRFERLVFDGAATAAMPVCPEASLSMLRRAAASSRESAAARKSVLKAIVKAQVAGGLPANPADQGARAAAQYA